MASSTSPLFNISGIASGVDTNSIVTKLMQIERQPQTRLIQRQTTESARHQALRDVNTRLMNLQTAINGLRDAGTWGDRQSVDSSDPSRISAVRTGGVAAGGYQLAVTRLARAQQLTQSTAATAASADGTLTVKLGAGDAVNVAVSAGDSLQTVADRINGTSGSQVYATVASGKLVLSGKLTGATNTISVTGSSSADFGFGETQTALDSAYSIDGAAHTSGSNVVTDGLAGVTLTLKGLTTAPVSITVGAPGPDSAAVQDRVKAFVDQYNSTLEFIQGKLTEKPVANPTNDAQRTKGVLYGDSSLRGLLTSLRSAIALPISGRPTATSMLSQVGVSTGAATSGTLNQDAIAGKLTLDADALGSQLNAHFADTKALFTNPTNDQTTEGVAQRLNRLVDRQISATSGLLTGRIASQQSTIDDLKKQADAMESRMTAREASLRAQYTAMETAMSQAQAHGQFLAAHLAGLQSSSS
jgi:flagellar hook-associated protein 2